MFKSFKVGELFDIHPTNAYKMKNDELFAIAGTTPVMSNSSVNNGIGGYCGLDPTEQGGIITFSDTTTGADTMFYQANPFIGYPHVQGMYPHQSDRWDEKVACMSFLVFENLQVMDGVMQSSSTGRLSKNFPLSYPSLNLPT